MKKALLCMFLILYCHFGFSQIKDFGIPSIVNYPRGIYNASTQNWSVTQSDKSFIYVGNNDGVLEFDGTHWTTFPMPNQSVVRSVKAIGDTIYTGAFEEIGFLAPDETGRLRHHSLNHLIHRDYKGFDEIWNIYEHQGKIIFQSFNYIFIYSGQTMEVLEPLSSFSMLHLANGKFFVVDTETGLMEMKNNSLSLVSAHPVFFRNEIRCILPLGHERFLVGTSNEGLFVLENQRLRPWDVEVNDYLREHNLFSAIKLADGNFAFGSVRNGVFISNPEGKVLQHFNRYKGLQNNTILSLFQDSRRNLWLGLDNGIDYVEISSPITFLNYNYNIESAYASIVHNGIMYVGTNQGLYAARFSEISGAGNLDEKFRLIKGTEGQVWSLEVIDNTLFCGHNFGSFQIDGFTARQISDIRGFWSFLKLPGFDNMIIAGTYTGLVRLVNVNGRWSFLDEVDGFRESSRSMFLDEYQNLWVSHGYRGLYKLRMNNTFDTVTHAQLFKGRAGLPDELPYNIQIINQQMFITTQDGLFKHDAANGVFFQPDEINRMFEGKGFINKIHQDRTGNLWYFTNNYIGVMRWLEDGTYRDITAPFTRVNENLLPAFENLFIFDTENVFIGSQIGLIHYDPTLIKDYSLTESVYFKEVSFYGAKETLTYHSLNDSNANEKEPIQIPFALNSVTFRFTIPEFENPGRIRFSFRLQGFDDGWSLWDGINFKEYTNLREGNYTFEVKAVNAFGMESPVSAVSFTVEPPFYRSTIAYVFYGLILLLIIAGNFYYVRRRILKIRQREKIRHEKRLERRELMFKEKTALSEKEIMHLRNESLQNEMKHKNQELANTTLHLIHKNRTLTAIRNDLSKLLKATPSEKPETQVVNNLIKKINKDLRNEKNWELFNSYFDEVHQDFIHRIKEKHENLTPKELRLCAYLRMNISTKEIAPLMNISIRGVEISRYRLRTKLNLDRNTNLTEYIMSF
jgi:ligand-binding sensor domain-containing protein/DNA-binding CsgD family transcriptional regulator